MKNQTIMNRKSAKKLLMVQWSRFQNVCIFKQSVLGFITEDEIDAAMTGGSGSGNSGTGGMRQ